MVLIVNYVILAYATNTEFSYCNSIVQALYHSDSFRESIINYPPRSPTDTPNNDYAKANVTIRPPIIPAPPPPKQKLSTSQVLKQRQAINLGQTVPGQQPVKPEDKPDTPEYKKKHAMLKGPILELARENTVAYGMNECTFTGLKDIFLALNESNTRTGVLSPQRFLEIFKRDNELFRSANHQDAHEFYVLVLNDIVVNIEKNQKRLDELQQNGSSNGLTESVENIIDTTMIDHASGYRSPGTGWIHDIFELVLASETKCLTCETTSQREETFRALSIDLKEHSSVTSCLRKFSAEEMLCERNKFQCDQCGGLQEAERRVKLKRLPKVLTLHLKRFEYTEDFSRLQKLFHRVVYPYHLRLFNTADDTENPDRLYELYAVVVHVGGNAYHGHYVSIIKTKERGWVLFDDEMVEPVDKHFVRNFFGDKPGMATAYVLFYQETTFEKMRAEQEAEGMEEVKLATQAANVALGKDANENGDGVPLSKHNTTQPVASTTDASLLSKLTPSRTAPDTPTTGSPLASPIPDTPLPPVPPLPTITPIAETTVTSPTPEAPLVKSVTQTKEDKKREKKEKEAAEKAAKQLEKEKDKQAREEEKKKRELHIRQVAARRMEEEQMERALNASKKSAIEEEKNRSKDETTGNGSFLDRSKRGSKSISRKGFGLFGKDKTPVPEEAIDSTQNGVPPEKHERKSRLSIGLGRKKSSNILA